MTKHPATCRICHKPLVLEVDDGYAAIGGDPFKLLPLATCNRCGDIRERRVRTEELVARVCRSILPQMRPKQTVADTARVTLTKALEKYNAVMADTHNMSGGIEFGDALEVLMQRPDQWPEVLRRFRQVWQEQAEKPRELQPVTNDP